MDPLQPEPTGLPDPEDRSYLRGFSRYLADLRDTFAEPDPIVVGPGSAPLDPETEAELARRIAERERIAKNIATIEAWQSSPANMAATTPGPQMGGVANMAAAVPEMWGQMSPAQRAAVSTALVPGVGDFAGLTADIEDFVENPESRTPANFALAGAGLLPFVMGSTQTRAAAQAVEEGANLPAKSRQLVESGQQTMTGDQALNFLKNKGVKQEEFDELGLEAHLKQIGGDSITRDELMEFIDTNTPRYQVEHSGTPLPGRQTDVTDTPVDPADYRGADYGDDDFAPGQPLPNVDFIVDEVRGGMSIDEYLDEDEMYREFVARGVPASWIGSGGNPVYQEVDSGGDLWNVIHGDLDEDITTAITRPDMFSIDDLTDRRLDPRADPDWYAETNPISPEVVERIRSDLAHHSNPNRANTLVDSWVSDAGDIDMTEVPTSFVETYDGKWHPVFTMADAEGNKVRLVPPMHPTDDMWQTRPDIPTASHVVRDMSAADILDRPITDPAVFDGDEITMAGEGVAPNSGQTPTRYGNWTTPGWDEPGANYRETLIKAPREGWKPGTQLNWPGDPHWDGSVIAHLRSTVRTDPEGQRYLHIEEMQSDIHQKGRKRGYRGEKPTSYQVNKLMEDIEASVVDETTLSDGRRVGTLNVGGMEYDEIPLPEGMSNNEAIYQFLLDNDSDWIEDGIVANSIPVPNAPFKKTWPDLVLKEAMKIAEAEGADYISWTPGAEHYRRYPGMAMDDASGFLIGPIRRGRERAGGVAGNMVDNLVGEANPDDIVGWRIEGVDADGRRISKTAESQKDLLKFLPQKHRETVQEALDNSESGYITWGNGNEPDVTATDIMDKPMSSNMDTPPAKLGSINAESMLIGDQGLEQFYNSELPRRASKLWRQKPEVRTIKTADFDITPRNIMELPDETIEELFSQISEFVDDPTPTRRQKAEYISEAIEAFNENGADDSTNEMLRNIAPGLWSKGESQVLAIPITDRVSERAAKSNLYSAGGIVAGMGAAQEGRRQRREDK